MGHHHERQATRLIVVKRKQEPRFTMVAYDNDGNVIMSVDDIGLEMFAKYGAQPEQTLLASDDIRVAVRRS